MARDSWPPGTVTSCWQCPTQLSPGRAKSKVLRKPSKTGAGEKKLCRPVWAPTASPLQALLPGQNHRPRTPGPSDSGPLATSLGPPLPPVSTGTETFTRTRFKQPGPVSRALCRDVVGRMGWERPVPQRVSNTRKGGEETTLRIPLLSQNSSPQPPFTPNQQAAFYLRGTLAPPSPQGWAEFKGPWRRRRRGGLSQPLESPEGRRYSPLPGTQPQTSLLASRRGNGNSAPPTASRSLLPVAPTPPGS